MEKLDQRKPPRRFQVVAEQDEKSGRWTAACPFCKSQLKGMTFVGTETKVFEHLNASHDRRGH